MRILLTAARSPVTLELARLLSSAGHEVSVAETSQWHVCKFSRAAKRSFVLPSPRVDASAYIQELVRIVTLEDIDLLIPTWEDILYISAGMAQFPDSCQVFSMPFDQVHTLHNKWLFCAQARRHGLGVPDTWLLDSKEALHTLPRDRDLILKLSYSRATQQIHVVKAGEKLPKVNMCRHNPWIAQELVEGKKYCSYSICVGGRVRAHTSYPVHYAIDDSSCVFFRPIQHDGIRQWIESFANTTSFTGQVAFDFIEDANGRLCAIECNPRTTSGVHLFSDVKNFAEAFLPENAPILEPPIGTRRQIATGMLLYGWRCSAARASLPAFFKALFSTRDVVFSWKDPLPFLSQVGIMGKYVSDAMRLGIPLPAAFTYDLDWNGELNTDKPSALQARPSRRIRPRGLGQTAVTAGE